MFYISIVKFLFSFFIIFHGPSTYSKDLNVVQSSPLKKITLGLNWKPEPQFGGFYQALIKNEYKKFNYDMEILEGGSGTPTIQMLSNGKINYGIVSAEELIIANERNPKNPIVALYAVYKINPQMIMTHQDRDFKSLKDVFQSDGILAIQQGLSYAQYLKKIYAPVKVKIVPYLGGIGNFQNNKNYSQQGFVNSEDLLAEKAGIKIKYFLVSDSGFNPYTTVLATQAQRIKNQPDEVRQVTKATRAGWQSYLKSPEESNQHMARLNKSMDVLIMNKAAKSQKALIDVPNEELGVMSLERLQKLQDQLLDLGVIKTKSKLQDYFLLTL